MNLSRDSLSLGWKGESKPKACIVGLGLIGGSWAGALHKLGWIVEAVDTNLVALTNAKEKGWIQEGWRQLPEKLDADLVILALPLHVIKTGLMDLMGRLKKGSIITDVGSIKGWLWDQTEEFLEQGTFFIGGHPMNGSEKSGFSQADPFLFKDYPYVLADHGCPDFAVKELERLLEQIGAKVVYRKPEIHDFEVAMISHVPHLLSVALALAAQDCSAKGYAPLELAGRSFRDITRIASSSPELWQEILLKNSSPILHSLECCQQRLDEMASYIRSGNGDKIAEAFRKAALVRKEL